MFPYWKELCTQCIETVESYALSNQRRFRYLLHSFNEQSLLYYGRKRAGQAALRAYKYVPAYSNFLTKNKLNNADVAFEDLPVMDKNSYVRAYPTEQRCLNGSFLSSGVLIDESSGSTGTPYNWVRGKKERLRTQNLVARVVEWFVSDRKDTLIAINAFSMGAWATGVNMGEALSQVSVVKSTGPDLDKILHTLEFFGPKYAYIICGYPPFLKLIIDTAIERKFPIQNYQLHSFVGGEGMSEDLRQYILKSFKSCISGYGASDLEMGIATETPESIAIRHLLNQNKDLRADILDGDARVPMVFQYNPLTHYLETNERD
ncbi:MAG: phenylacetate--CoA ligase family protein, partial [Rickettsiaceae bacterium]|nr:phenylacetate--CoA ligase family protein [Rickettsiaceae bacterium]